MFMQINQKKELNMKVITMESSAFTALTEQIAEIAAHVRAVSGGIFHKFLFFRFTDGQSFTCTELHFIFFNIFNIKQIHDIRGMVS